MRKNYVVFKKKIHFRLHFSCSSSDCDSTSLPADPSGDPSDQVVPGGGQVISSKHSNLSIIMITLLTKSELFSFNFRKFYLGPAKNVEMGSRHWSVALHSKFYTYNLLYYFRQNLPCLHLVCLVPKFYHT